jgi:hypothetical protein
VQGSNKIVSFKIVSYKVISRFELSFVRSSAERPDTAYRTNTCRFSAFVRNTRHLSAFVQNTRQSSAFVQDTRRFSNKWKDKVSSVTKELCYLKHCYIIVQNDGVITSCNNLSEIEPLQCNLQRHESRVGRMKRNDKENV